MKQNWRKVLYGVSTVVGLVVLIVGWATEEQIIMALGLIEGVLGNTVATMYTPWERKPLP